MQLTGFGIGSVPKPELIPSWGHDGIIICGRTPFELSKRSEQHLQASVRPQR